MTSKSLRAWRASFTRRWHQNYDLCDTVDPIGFHQGRVALLMLTLFPDCSRELLKAAVTHDQGEVRSGDVSYVTKLELGDDYAPLHDLECHEMARQGFDLNLTKSEVAKLKLCDYLDAWLWMMRHKPSLKDQKDWMRQRANIIQLSVRCGVEDEVREIVG